MIKRYRYFALVSCAILAYFVLTSQYLYQDLGGRHSVSLPNLNNGTASAFSGHSSSASSRQETGGSDIVSDSSHKKFSKELAQVKENNRISSPHKVIVDVKYSTSVVETKSNQQLLPEHPVNYNNKKQEGSSESPEQDQKVSSTVSQVRKELSTSTLKNISRNEELDAADPAAKWLSVIQDATSKLFNLLSGQDLPKFRKWAVEKERDFLKDEMRGFNFPPNKSLSDLVIEHGGQPVRNLVFTTWRSGSTFLGEILHSHPGTYYHYEPLLHFGLVQVREGERSKEALRVVRELLNCRYQSLGDYMKNGETQHWVYNHNKRIWNFCYDTRQVCWDPQWLSTMCRMFPFQAMKTVRMRLDLARPLLEDKTLNVRVLYLVRDPRGTMQSRSHRDWCPGNPDCEQPARLCKDLVSDYYAAQRLRQDFPDRFMIVRYEDMAGSIYKAAKKILKFFRLQYHPQVKRFLDVHTKSNIGGVSSTFRDTKSAPFHWIQDFSSNFTVVETIQNSCREAMALWGYDVVESPEELKGFNPVMDAPWKDMAIPPAE